MRHTVIVNEENFRLADMYFGGYVRTLTPRKQDIARATRELVLQGIYPSGQKVCQKIGRRGLDQSEGAVRYAVYHAYMGSQGVIQSWQKQFSRPKVRTGLMFRKEIMK